MATSPFPRLARRWRTDPLAPGVFAAVAGIVWLAGALYCSGYEALSTGLDNWPGSLWWSAIAVLPWLALFEYSRSRDGRRRLSSAARIGLALALTALVSVALERGADWSLSERSAPIVLTMLRRLPAIGAALLLILWSRTESRTRTVNPEAEASLAALAPSIAWIEAADNYVALHIGERAVMRRMTMRDAEDVLGPRGFIRIHRRYLVNRNCIAAICAGTEPLIRLDSGTELPVGRSFAANLPRAA
jgi:hypothetical protein